MADEAHLSDIVAEISSILDWDPEKLQQEVAYEAEHPGSHVRMAWESSVPQQADEVEAFYSRTDAYILDLMVESEREVRQRWRSAVTETLDHWWGGADGAAILDYGGGVGTDTLWFAKHCRSAAYYDVPGLTSDFAMKRFAKRGAGISRMMRTTDHYGRFDALVSFEVLEHLVDPPAHLDEMTRLVKTGGLLFLTESFGLVTEDYPSHIPANLAHAGQIDNLMLGRGCHPIALLEDRIHVYAKGPDVTVIVPIYNAYDHVCRLLDSIRTTSAGYPVSWLLVNDASPDARISPLLAQFAETFEGTVRVIDRTENFGFPRTCNEAMEAAGTDDVILLNSDTILYDGWARKLVQGAYENPSIATATPMSNNASAFSTFEHITPQNTINRTLGAANLPLITIPVGVGFCLFIKREALDRVGLFDPIFGKGYGEETDFCLRAAKAGYRHVLVPRVFVYHAGNASMLEANVVRKGESTVEEHERTVSSRYPDFGASVHRFLTSGTMEQLSWDLTNRHIAAESSKRPSIAVVVHDDVFSPVIGGTTEHLRDLVRELGSEFVFYFITPLSDESGVRVTAYVDGVTETIAPYHADYLQVLTELNPSLVHIHHLLHFNQQFIDALVAWSGPKYYTVHDYYAVCEQFTLLNFRQQFCNVPGPDECGTCAKALFHTGYAAIAERRSIYQRLIDSCTRVLAPSETAMTIFRRAYQIPDIKALVLPHPIVIQKYRNMLGDPFAQFSPASAALSIAAAAEERRAHQATAGATGKRAAAVASANVSTSRVNQPPQSTQLAASGGSSSYVYDDGDESDAAVATAGATRVAVATATLPGTTGATGARKSLERKMANARLRVGFIGYDATQKGTAVLQGIIAACAHDPILFVSIGDIGKGAARRPNLISTGAYDRQEVVDLIQANKVDVMIVASIWPESYCFTLSEAWMAGVPVLTGPIGAQAERVRTSGAGIALPDLNVATFVRALRQLMNDKTQLEALTRATMLVTPANNYGAYREAYTADTAGLARQTRLFSSVRREPPKVSLSATDAVPLLAKLVAIRKRVFPIGSRRERFYFFLHNLVTSSYAS